MADRHLNPISFLQEFCQKNNNNIFPEYLQIENPGPTNQNQFVYKCKYGAFEAVAMGYQKKKAKTESARCMIELLEKTDYFNKVNHHDGKSKKLQEDETQSKNPISALQEYCQGLRTEMPIYQESASTEGGFSCRCVLLNNKTVGQGTNKKSAKTDSAYKMCIKLNIAVNQKGYESAQPEKPVQHNAVSALMKYCSEQEEPFFPDYDILKHNTDCFEVVCKAGELISKATDTTLLAAQHLAASKVFGQLLKRKQLRKTVDSGLLDEPTSQIESSESNCQNLCSINNQTQLLSLTDCKKMQSIPGKSDNVKSKIMPVKPQKKNEDDSHESPPSIDEHKSPKTPVSETLLQWVKNKKQEE